MGIQSADDPPTKNRETVARDRCAVAGVVSAITLATMARIELMGLEDLVQAKRTQRDKDWPMIRRLVESHYATHWQDPTEAQKQLWLGHSRTPEMLIDLVSREPELASQVAAQRPLISLARDANPDALQQALDQEAARERQADRLYWAPLKAELE